PLRPQDPGPGPAHCLTGLPAVGVAPPAIVGSPGSHPGPGRPALITVMTLSAAVSGRCKGRVRSADLGVKDLSRSFAFDASGACLGYEMNGSRQRGLAAPFALVTGFGMLFALGTVAAGLHGRISPTAMLIGSAAVVTALSFVAEPLAAIPLGFVGWLTAV